MEFESLFSLYRQRSALNKSQVAERLKVTPSYIMLIESGSKKPPTLEKVRDLAKIFGLSKSETEQFINAAARARIKPELAEFIAEKTADPRGSSKIQRIPVVSWVAANRFHMADDPFPVGTSDEFIYTTAKGKGVFALRVKYDCMEPEFLEGDIIIIDPHAHAESGDFIIIKDIRDNEASFKQLKKYGDKTILHPLNPKYQDIELDHSERYIIIGKVVEKVKKY